jgi:tripartite-type tricarboxylate transporter receptor subunit TctC
VHVPYPGNPQVVIALIGGDIQLALVPLGIALPQAKSGKLAMLGITARTPSPLAPDVPTLAQQGVTGFELEVWNALVAPANMPRAAQQRLVAEVYALLNDEAIAQKLLAAGWQAAPSTPQQLTGRVQREGEAIVKLLAERGIKLE